MFRLLLVLLGLSATHHVRAVGWGPRAIVRAVTWAPRLLEAEEFDGRFRHVLKNCKRVHIAKNLGTGFQVVRRVICRTTLRGISGTIVVDSTTIPEKLPDRLLHLWPSWSKALDLSPNLFGGMGSNPIGCIFFAFLLRAPLPVDFWTHFHRGFRHCKKVSPSCRHGGHGGHGGHADYDGQS